MHPLITWCVCVCVCVEYIINKSKKLLVTVISTTVNTPSEINNSIYNYDQHIR